ncbi:MAG: hypothetical protein HQ591_13125 [candidate division Zixibacteria bacterium]|nr:hypothetical protein [Candidatus Tariuqbacter arcticus]
MHSEISPSLHFASHTLQEFALLFMAVVYVLRIIWLLSFPAGKERQAATGPPGTTPAKGILYSWLNIGMPWGMESTRKKFFLYVQFVVFHLGVTVAIGLSIIIPYAPELLTSAVLVRLLQVMIWAAFIVGCMRIIRRFGLKYMRAISSPDDYFCLLLLTGWFFFAALSVNIHQQKGEFILITYFWMTAFFLVYVPFSKISHYLYYPFTRYYFGKTMGYRGVYPMRRSVKPDWMNDS